MKTIEQAAREHANEYWGENYNTECKNYNEAGFTSGVEFAQKWIPVDEELPPVMIPVIAKMSYNLALTNIPAVDCCVFNGDAWFNAMRQQHSNGNVTHWRPIELK